MRGKINEFLFIKGTVFMPFSFRKKVSTKHNIVSTEIACQFSAPKVPVSRGNKATNSRTSSDLCQLQRKAMSLAIYSSLLDLSSHSHGQLVFHWG